jgi:S1-C subfamily serine protease
VSAISGRSAGSKITLGIERGGQSKSVTVTLEQQPTQAPTQQQQQQAPQLP